MKDKLKVKQIENMCIILNNNDIKDGVLFRYVKTALTIPLIVQTKEIELMMLRMTNHHRQQWLINNKRFCLTFPSVDVCTNFIQTLSRIKGLEISPMKLKDLL